MRLIDADALIEFCAERWIPLNIDAVNMQPTIEPSTNCSEFPNNSDTISRQAVIDLLKQMRKDGDMVPWEGKDVFARIRKLPTIQPEKTQLSKESTTKDVISRQAAIDAVNNAFDRETLLTGFVRSIAVRAIRDMPSVQPEPHEGQWIWVAGDLECSKCHTRYPDLYPDYDNSVACPHCGARMKGASE